MAKKQERPAAPRSRKAGRPPEATTRTPQGRRRARTATTAFRKDSTIHQAADGPRVIMAAGKPKEKKR
jgi:hypothetical protein